MSYGRIGLNATLTAYQYCDCGKVSQVTRGHGLALAETTSYQHDLLGRLVSITHPGGAVVTHGYDTRGRRTSTTDALGTQTFVYDNLNRLRETWNAFGRTEGRLYDDFDWVTSRTNSGNVTTTTSYDALGRLTHRWIMTNTSTGAGAVTEYRYDVNGNLILVNYPTGTTDVSFLYDALNRVTTMVDATGTTTYTYSNGLLQSENGPWNGDTVSYAYNTARQRNQLVILQPTGNAWTNTDLITTYTPNVLNQAAGSYDARGNRISGTDSYTYDAENQLIQIEQASSWKRARIFHTLSAAAGCKPVWRRWPRVPRRTVCPHTARLGTASAALPDGLSLRLATKSCETSGLEFVYDGRQRLRIIRDFECSGGSYTQRGETRLVYDGLVPIQERNSSSNPTVTYTRGTDLSGTFEGAGGIGGLLARSTHAGSTPFQPNSHAFYDADGNGNVTCLTRSDGSAVGMYKYDPFGRTLATSGTLASANRMRFSSKPWVQSSSGSSGYYAYGYRFYDPTSQRWLNRDPIQERGGCNVYAFVLGNPASHFDADGRAAMGWGVLGPPGSPPSIITPPGDAAIDEAMKWLQKCHPRLANCGNYPRRSNTVVVLGLFVPGGAEGFTLGNNTLLHPNDPNVQDVDDVVRVIAHEKMHCLDDPSFALEPYHTDVIEGDALAIAAQYRSDPTGSNCNICGGGYRNDFDNRFWPKK